MTKPAVKPAPTPGVKPAPTPGLVAASPVAPMLKPVRPPAMSKDELIRFCSPTAVDIELIVQRADGYYASHGAGVILHEAGYVLTASHVVVWVKGIREGLKLHDGTYFPFRRVGFATDYDIGILKFEPGKPLRPARIGRSTTSKVGDPILLIGNPHGRAHHLEHGIITHLRRGGTGRFQVDGADINPGDSGAPVYDYHGDYIGMVQIKNTALRNVSYSLRVDHLRKGFALQLMDEKRYDYRVGIKVDCYGPARITEVAAGSPAERAGLKVGDVIRKFGPMRIDDGIHYVLALMDLNSDQPRPLVFERGGRTFRTMVSPTSPQMREAVQVAGLVPGVSCSAYLGQWRTLPDFGRLTPVSSNTVPKFGLFIGGDRTDEFGLTFTGYIRLAVDGRYTFYASSDDGSRLWIGDQLVVDNDGLHAVGEKNGNLHLKAGLHPIKVSFFELSGDEALQVSYEGPGLKKQEIPASALLTVGK